MLKGKVLIITKIIIYNKNISSSNKYSYDTGSLYQHFQRIKLSIEEEIKLIMIS